MWRCGLSAYSVLTHEEIVDLLEDLYFKSINTTVDQYRAFLEAVRTDSLVVPNCDLDSGNVTKAAEYSLTDDTHATLLAQLSERKFDRTSPELRDNILQFIPIPRLQSRRRKTRFTGKAC